MQELKVYCILDAIQNTLPVFIFAQDYFLACHSFFLIKKRVPSDTDVTFETEMYVSLMCYVTFWHEVVDNSIMCLF